MHVLQLNRSAKANIIAAILQRNTAGRGWLQPMRTGFALALNWLIYALLAGVAGGGDDKE